MAYEKRTKQNLTFNFKMPLLNKIGVLFPSLKSLAAAVMLLTQEDRDLDGDTLRYQAELQC